MEQGLGSDISLLSGLVEISLMLAGETLPAWEAEASHAVMFWPTNI